uniref:Phosphodiesterase n=1 Tax=Aplanochytrium stocchinoi TaxID=215587 RepID=A0A7S3PNG3_9STRA|mmetsp:Transcript_22418/g.28657  ORF Transcript_22418/g.28657 Transcript_22418/m.28657 type:complete len:483 (+) Transcript_22418:403-1851(+)
MSSHKRNDDYDHHHHHHHRELTRVRSDSHQEFGIAPLGSTIRKTKSQHSSVSSIGDTYSDLGSITSKGKFLKRTKSRKGELKRKHGSRRESFAQPIQDLLNEGDLNARNRRKSLSVSKSLKEKFSNSKVETSSVMKSLKKMMFKTKSEPRIAVYDIGFDIFKKSEEDLLRAMQMMCKDFHLELVFGKDWTIFNNLTSAIKSNYRSNPFHNWYHAFSVAHMATVFMVRNPCIPHTLGPRYHLAFIIAALGHDLNHPGNDNSFEINSHSALAESYNHESVLENYHVSILLQLLNEEDKNIFYLADPKVQSEIKDFMVEVVLATDMKYHHESVKYLQDVDNVARTIKNKLNRLSVMKAVMHACDISGQCIDLPVAIAWEARISKEMENQAKAQKAQGIELPPHMDVETLTNSQNRAVHQLGFIDNILLPLWGEIQRVFPSMKPLYTNLNLVVRKHYMLLHEEGEHAARLHALQYENKSVFDDDLL